MSDQNCAHPNTDHAPGMERASVWCWDCKRWVIKTGKEERPVDNAKQRVEYAEAVSDGRKLANEIRAQGPELSNLVADALTAEALSANLIEHAPDDGQPGPVPDKQEQSSIKLAEANRELAKQRATLTKAIWPDEDIYVDVNPPDDGGAVGYRRANGSFRNFDPFTDANDDYAVLEWMRSKSDDQHIAFVCDVDFTALNYHIGDYARAALKVLEQEQSSDE